MKLKYLAHSSFLLTSDSGTRIVTDPYSIGPDFRHKAVSEVADIVTVSHDHGDHNAVSTIQGSPDVISAEGTIQSKGISIKGVATYHDEAEGKQRGKNIVFCFTVDGVNVCHMGDLGHLLNRAQIEELGNVDVLLIPVGGNFTIDAAAATKICDDLKPGIIVPMHYKTKEKDIPIAGVEDFITGKKNVEQKATNEVQVEKNTLPAGTVIYVLNSAL
jgi:L-ascorbate metabolism protein UlaG (beta-lactamase superfamily)